MNRKTKVKLPENAKIDIHIIPDGEKPKVDEKKLAEFNKTSREYVSKEALQEAMDSVYSQEPLTEEQKTEIFGKDLVEDEYANSFADKVTLDQAIEETDGRYLLACAPGEEPPEGFVMVDGPKNGDTVFTKEFFDENLKSAYEKKLPPVNSLVAPKSVKAVADAPIVNNGGTITPQVPQAQPAGRARHTFEARPGVKGKNV